MLPSRTIQRLKLVFKSLVRGALIRSGARYEASGNTDLKTDLKGTKNQILIHIELIQRVQLIHLHLYHTI